MKKQKSAIKTTILLTILLLASLFLFQIIWSHWAYRENTETRDSAGNMIFIEKIPYYGYREEIFVNDDQKNMMQYMSLCYLSKENEDYLISDYKDGVCINKYYGDEANIVIPETLDGKKVVKIGWDVRWSEDGESLNYSPAFNDEYKDDFIKSVHISSAVKDITDHAFTAMGAKLVKITVDKNNPYYFSFCGMLFSLETKLLLFNPWDFEFFNIAYLTIALCGAALTMIFVIIKFVKHVKLRNNTSS